MDPLSLSILTEGILSFTAQAHGNGDLFHSFSASHEELVSGSSKPLVVSQLCSRRFYPGYQDVFQCQKGIGKTGECSGGEATAKFPALNFLLLLPPVIFTQ